MDQLENQSMRPLLRSSLWESTPVDCPPGSSIFLNAAVALEPLPGETPRSLLVKLQQLEIEFGRQPKKVVNEPRPLDLDLIAFGREVLSLPHLILPHPRAHLRKFVLKPLKEIAPHLILPGQHQTVAQLLEQLDNREIVLRVGRA